MATTVIDNLKFNVNELDKIYTIKEKLAHDVKKNALNFFKNSLEAVDKEQVSFDDLLGTKSSWLSRILGLSDEKTKQPYAKSKFISTDTDRPSLRQKMQEVSNVSTSYTHDEIGCDR